MTKEDFLRRISETVEFIDSGHVVKNGREFNGHPKFFLLHTKEEFNEELNRVIPEKKEYNKYDFYYIMNHMFKYVLNEYDSHTFVAFNDSKYLPIVLKVINNKLYIVDSHKKYEKFVGMEIKNINGVDISKIIKELDFIKCYASKDFFNTQIESCLKDVDVLRSLPSIGNVDRIVLSDNNESIDFDIKNLEKFIIDRNDLYYKIQVFGDVLVFTYIVCKDIDKMNESIRKIESIDNINHYVVDIRGNAGGDSSVNKPLVDFLKDKDTYVLCNEEVFSSARMCLADLKRNGACVIGKRPGTPISCFGNCLLKKDYDDLDLFVRGSVNYWYYDENLICHGITKENFEQALEKEPKILNTVYGDVDIEVEPTLEDYINKNDSVLNYTLDYIKENKLTR